ncbi:CaiF/GrlA family transcriptional regulator [Salmonella enterica]|nr:CaiF/GrlA family transcriptional regulator [Salmonella enterica]
MRPDNTCTKKKIIVPANDIHYPVQTNHDACFIPECVRKYNGEPLYILVAYWCQQQKGWVQRNQISEAFHITVRRASYLISYLRNKAGRVDCECRESVPANKVSRYEIRVTTIRETPLRGNKRRHQGPPVIHRKGGMTASSEANDLWNQLCLQRSVGRLLNKKKETNGE